VSRCGARIATVLAAMLVGCARERPAPPGGGAWMRPAEQGSSSAIYVTLRNPTSDTAIVTGVEVDVAGNARMHRSVDSNGTARMVPLDTLVIPPRDSAVFAERGLHIMVMGLRAALVPGDTVVARIRMRSSRVDTLRVVVRG
jgi:periplasmic copper chaperone A